MADKSIIFSGPMVRALLDGTKTQTRRVIKKKAAFDALAIGGPSWLTLAGNCDLLPINARPGDRLWVREAFWTCDQCGHRNMCEGGANHSGHIGRWCCASCDELLPRAKTSPIFMPRWASRLTLTVTDVRVQRLQEISEADARAEGVSPITEPNDLKWEHYAPHGAAFVILWNSINGPGAWDANPWVAAYTFTVQRGNIDNSEVS